MKNDKRLTKRGVLYFVLVLITGWIILGWIYPLSIFSMSREIEYKPDPISIKDFKVNFSTAENRLNKSNKSDSTTDLILKTYNVLKSEPWILSLKEQKISSKDLTDLQHKISNIYYDFISLKKNQYLKYDKNERALLDVLIVDLQRIGNQLDDITSNNYLTRSKLTLAIKNLQNKLIGLCNSTDSFYREYLR